MAYTINTNITSLQAQEYLRTTTDFQSKTINRVTSGLRIISSGDDAAGLAIANSFRSDRAVLTQGVRNANDGLSTLQTIDGGMNNISMLLDRARTLAAQSASGTFTGDRAILNSEFQSVLGEIDRQAQAIGLDQGGTFAKQLSVFIGGGRANAGVSAIDNGSVAVDLSQSTVDSKSMGLKGVQAVGVAGTDIGSGATSTNVQEIVNDATNIADQRTAGFTELRFFGPGFSDSDGVTIAVNTQGITDTSTLVEAVNAAIESAGNGSTQAATAFRDAGVEASVVTDSSGRKQLAFSSSDVAFQVKANDLMANALMGNYTSSSNPTGKNLDTTVAAAGTLTTANTFAGTADIVFRFQGAGMTSPVDITTSVTSSTTVAAALTDLSSQVAANSTLKAAGITVTETGNGNNLTFTSDRGEKFDVTVSNDTANEFGMGSFIAGASGAFDYTTITAAFNDGATGTANFEFSFNGGASSGNKVAFAHTNGTSTASDLVDALNQAFAADAEMSAAGLKASTSGGNVTIESTNGTYFRVNTYSGTTDVGFGDSGATFTGNTVSNAPSDSAQVNAGGSAATTALTFSDLNYGTDDQTITVSANDPTGSQVTEAIVLKNDGSTTRDGRNIDSVIRQINQELQQTNNETLQKIIAVKVNDSGTEKIQFLSSLQSFNVTSGTNASGNGIGSQGTTDNAAVTAGGSTAAIDSQAGAASAVLTLADAVATLGSAQAVVGKGQNRFNFAVSLAQTQLNNLAASESRIRDADLAAEAANLTKAQILQQAGIAALSQANVAPQAVLSLLRG